jgi:hypothetical protein
MAEVSDGRWLAKATTAIVADHRHFSTPATPATPELLQLLQLL